MCATLALKQTHAHVSLGDSFIGFEWIVAGVARSYRLAGKVGLNLPPPS